MRTFALAFALSIALGCNKEPAPETKGGTAGSSSAPIAAASTSASASAAPSAMAGKHHKGMRKGGVGGLPAMLFHEASELPLDAAKKTKVEDLQKQTFADMPRQELKSLHEEIVSEVKAGKIDQAKIDAKHTDVEKAMKAHQDKVADALDQLHATLDAEQRKTVVAKVREDLKKREERMAKWKDKAKENQKEKGPKAGGFAACLTKQLDLDEAQQKKLEAIMPKGEKAMPDFEAIKKRNDALLDSFEKDAFDAKKLEVPAEEQQAHGPMDGKFLSQLLPILKPEQREKLANSMSKPMGPHGPMGGPNAAPSAAPPDDDGDDDDKP